MKFLLTKVGSLNAMSQVLSTKRAANLLRCRNILDRDWWKILALPIPETHGNEIGFRDW
jgi:hypothetical protein